MATTQIEHTDARGAIAKRKYTIDGDGVTLIPHVVVDGASVNIDITSDTPLPVQENGSALTALQALAATIASGSLKVVLQAGTAAFGKLTANAGVNIGTVDVATLPSLVLAAGSAAIGKLAANTAGVLIGMVELAPPSAGFSGQFTVATAGTAVQLNGGSSQALKDGAEVVCDAGSAGHLLVRWATGSGASNGRRIYPGMSGYFAIDNINKLWVDASASGSTGSWSGS